MASKRIIRYKCPYCDKRFERRDLVAHVEQKHEDMIPENYTALRLVFNYVNKKPLDYNGKCTECGGPTQWDENKGRYDRQCQKKACKESYLRKFEQNMMRTKGVTRISATADGQEKMLANRKISGEYTFQDGTKKTYTGSYERKALEFMDKVMEMDPDDIVCPGPVLEYTYEGKTHIYITDFYYQPYNLIIEVKDGGNNPNKRNMPEYRAKQIAKEKFIIQHTNYNYLRLTDNDFSQLLSVFVDLKYEMTENTGERVIHVNESKELLLRKYLFLDIQSNKSKVLKYLKNNNQTQAYAQDTIDNYNGEIIVFDNKMIGRILVGDKRDKGFITDFIIDKEYRGNKLGSKLLDDAINKYGGYDLLVDKDNKLAIDMYRKRGFETAKTYKNQYYMVLKNKINESCIEESVRFIDLKNIILEDRSKKLSYEQIDEIKNLYIKSFKEDYQKFIKEASKEFNISESKLKSDLGIDIRSIVQPLIILYTDKSSKNDEYSTIFHGYYQIHGLLLESKSLFKKDEYLNDYGLNYSFSFLIENDKIIKIKNMSGFDYYMAELNESYVEESKVSKKYYHISQSNLDGKTLQPSIPNNYFTKNGYEDNKIKRVCFTDSIDNCLRALSQKCTGMELYVHILDGNYNVYTPSIDEVPDCKVTGEVWVTKPCKVKCIGKIKVIGDRGEDGLPFKYGDKTAELYDWDWEWIEQISESVFDRLQNSYKYGEVKKINNELIDKINSTDYPWYFIHITTSSKRFNIIDESEITLFGYDKEPVNGVDKAYSISHILYNKKVKYDFSGKQNLHPDLRRYTKYNKGAARNTINESFEYEIVDEMYIKDEYDIMYNKEAFDNGDINLCFITGHSGSGKSTYAHYLEKKYHPNIEVYELDDVIATYNFSDENLKEYGDMINSFFKKNPKYRIPNTYNSDNVEEWIKDNKFASIPEYSNQVSKEFVKYAKNFVKYHSRKYIIEGIQLFCYFKPEEFKDYAFYIKGTSAFKSWIRSAIRDGKDGFKNKWMMLKDYNWYEQQLYKFRDYYAPKTKNYKEEEMDLKESTDIINELMTAAGYDPVVGIEKSDAYIVNYMSNQVFNGEPSEYYRDKIAVTNTRDLHDVVGLDDKQRLRKLKLEEIHNPILYKSGKTNEEVSALMERCMNSVVFKDYVYETITGQRVYGDVESQAAATLDRVEILDREKFFKILKDYLLPTDEIDLEITNLENKIRDIKNNL